MEWHPDEDHCPSLEVYILGALQEVNKIFKFALKNYLMNPVISVLITSTIVEWAESYQTPSGSIPIGLQKKGSKRQAAAAAAAISKKKFFLSDVLEMADPNNFYNAKAFFSFMIGRSKCSDAIVFTENNVNVVLLRSLLLLLVCLDKSNSSEEEGYLEEHLSLFQSLGAVYRGTMSITDRLTLRVPSILDEKNLCPSTDNILISNAPPSLSHAKPQSNLSEKT